jgi:predicted transcriptional regulator
MEIEEKLRRTGTRLFNSRRALDDNYQQARTAAAEAADAGLSQHRIAELLGVDRMTVRKWVGKR